MLLCYQRYIPVYIMQTRVFYFVGHVYDEITGADDVICEFF